uniref:hypothetical protein n=1 Tax=Roseburia sp. TaxID=2049040 RepID=UPI003FEE188A
MREFGGYIEIEHYKGNEYHTGCLALNSGRNCLRYLIRARQIRKIMLPRLQCQVIEEVCRREGVQIQWYEVKALEKPYQDEQLEEEVFLYLINYYGQLEKNYLEKLLAGHKRVIVDNAQDFFCGPIEGVDTIYTCRKFFGVPDGAYLYTDAQADFTLQADFSYDRMGFLLGRYECGAEKFYQNYRENEAWMDKQGLSAMSALTHNILRSIDYERVEQTRTSNAKRLDAGLGENNLLTVKNMTGAYLYPYFCADGEKLRKKLIERKIFVPVLWQNVLEDCDIDTAEYNFSKNMVPLPCDQRYTENDMDEVIAAVKELEER